MRPTRPFTAVPVVRALTALLGVVLLAGCAPSQRSGNATVPLPPPTTNPSPTQEDSIPPAPPPASSGPSTYLALGDSVAAGVGAATPATGGYVPLLADRLSTALGCAAGSAPGCPLELHNLARSGATTATLLREQLPRALDVLRNSTDVRLVTLTIGGNDVVEPVVRACAPAPQAQTCRAAVVTSLRNADEGIEEVLRAVREAVGPDTTVAVMTYYNPLPACQFASLQTLADQVLEGTSGQPGLNDVLRMRAAQYAALVVDTGDRLSAPTDFVGGSDCLHPSGPGHAQIAAAFFDVVGVAVTTR